MSQLLLAFRWYVAIQAFGLAALPLGLRLFRHLPDRGYGVSKPLGLLLAGWGFWLLATFGWLHNTAGGIVVVLAFSLMLALSPVVGTAVAARTLPPEAMVAPVPFTATVSDGSVTSAVTATPAISSEAAVPFPTPGFVLPPTPPEPGI